MQKVPRDNSENIVKKEMEKMGIPDNAVAEIMSFHGGVHGMVPREVWDWECLPLHRDPRAASYDMVDVSSMHFNFYEIANVIRNRNWSLFSEYVDLATASYEEYSISIKIGEQNIRDLINRAVEVDFEHATREGQAKITGYRKGIVELTETRYRNGVRKTSKHRCALSRFKRLEVIANYKFVEYEKGWDTESDEDTLLSPDTFDGFEEWPSDGE